MNDLYSKNCIRTFSGQWLDVFDPDPECIKIEDIAHALSHQPRFGGHLPKLYSVAQHSVHCAELARDPHKLAALLHDASEGLGLLDLPKPIKNRMPEYQIVEEKLMQCVASKFGFEWPLSDEVKRIDQEMLKTEWNALMISDRPKIRCWSPEEAKEEFLKKFYLLVKR